MSKQKLNEVIITPETLEVMYERYRMDTLLHNVDPPESSRLVPTGCTVTLIVLVVAAFIAFVWCGVTG